MATLHQNMRKLEMLQRLVTNGQIADEQRKRLICQLHAEGVTQVDLSDRLTLASERCGGGPVGLDAVQKIYSRYRHRYNGD